MRTGVSRTAQAGREHGFTLIEILVALAVIAISLGALVTAVSSQTRNAAYLTERTLAQWVAGNTVAGYRLDASWPGPGTSRGRSDMGEQTWHWQVTTTTTDDPDLRRIEVDVKHDPGATEPLVTLVAYLDRPAGAER